MTDNTWKYLAEKRCPWQPESPVPRGVELMVEFDFCQSDWYYSLVRLFFVLTFVPRGKSPRR